MDLEDIGGAGPGRGMQGPTAVVYKRKGAAAAAAAAAEPLEDWRQLVWGFYQGL